MTTDEKIEVCLVLAAVSNIRDQLRDLSEVVSKDPYVVGFSRLAEQCCEMIDKFHEDFKSDELRERLFGSGHQIDKCVAQDDARLVEKHTRSWRSWRRAVPVDQ